MPKQRVFVGESITFPIGVVAVKAFDDAVAVSVIRGVPPGATATFSPSRVSGLSLTIATSAATPSGSYPILLRGTAPAGDRDLTIELEVADSELVVVTNARTVAVRPGRSRSIEVSSATVAGIQVPVTYHLEGLPVGATASFSANPATGKTTMTVTVDPGALVGDHVLSLHARSGTIEQTMPIRFVIGGGYTIRLSPSALTVATGTTGVYQLELISDWSGPAAGDLNLSATGLPIGVTATFSAGQNTGLYDDRRTFTLSVAVPRGTHPTTSELTIAARADGGVYVSESVSLTIT